MAGAGGRRGGSSRGAGGGVGQSAVAKELHAAEEKIRQGSKETVVLRTADGRWEVIGGKKWSVSIPTGKLEQMRGGLLTHNHPSSQLHRGEVGRLARLARAGNLTSPFSPVDLSLARRWGMREMRVVGDTRKHRYRPQDGDSYRSVETAFKLGTQRAQKVYDRAKRTWARRLQDAPRSRQDRVIAQMNRALDGILAGQNYISQMHAMRLLKRAGFDLKSKRGRPLVTVRRT